MKEMRWQGIGSVAEGQAFLVEFMRLWNEKFAAEVRDPDSAHRPCNAPPRSMPSRR